MVPLTEPEIRMMILEAKDSDGDVIFGWQHAPTIVENVAQILAGKVCRCAEDKR